MQLIIVCVGHVRFKIHQIETDRYQAMTIKALFIYNDALS